MHQLGARPVVPLPPLPRSMTSGVHHIVAPKPWMSPSTQRGRVNRRNQRLLTNSVEIGGHGGGIRIGVIVRPTTYLGATCHATTKKEGSDIGEKGGRRAGSRGGRVGEDGVEVIGKGGSARPCTGLHTLCSNIDSDTFQPWPQRVVRKVCEM